ncbi:MAG: hypothetical protein HPY61_14575 [Methanotrichaceae archaeon]|nr:hypothetical protein [Methanotrichaceae archaeon]
MTGWAQCIEISFSANDVGIESCCDVDDDIYVYEEASADAESSGIRDYRKASGNGFIHADQYYYSPNYRGMAHAFSPDGGSVQGGAALTPAALNSWQSVSLSGTTADAFVKGEQSYQGGEAFTGQMARVNRGKLHADQSLNLGSSIYSSQDVEASGLFPIAVGYAATSGSFWKEGFNGQGAISAIGSCEEGKISGDLYAEVVRTQGIIDPLASGSNLEAEGDRAAGTIAAAGDIGVASFEDLFGSFDSIEMQGALVGAGALGKGSKISADYIEAGTDGRETWAGGRNLKAKSNVFSSTVAGSGSFRSSSADYYSGYYNNINVQGALAGSVGAGKDSTASASCLEAGTDGWETYAYGEHLKSKGDKLAAVLAGSGYLNKYSSAYTYGYGDGFAVQGALVGAAGAGKDSTASASYLEAGTDGLETYAYGEHLKSKGNKLAAVLAGSGYLNKYSSADTYGYGDGFAFQGALAGAAGAGKDSIASASCLEAGTDGLETYAYGERLEAKGNKLAVALAGSGNLNTYSSAHSSGYDSGFNVQGALAGAASAGKDSRVLADYLATNTNGQETCASGSKLKAQGNDWAAVLAASGRLDMSASNWNGFSSSYYSTSGALAGGLGLGKNSQVSAKKVQAATSWFETGAKVKGLDAKGKEMLAGAVAVYNPDFVLSPSWTVAGVYVDLKDGILYDSDLKADVSGSTTLKARASLNYDSAKGKQVSFGINPGFYWEGPVKPWMTWGNVWREVTV